MHARNDFKPIALMATAFTIAATLGGCASLGKVTGQTEETAGSMQSETAATTSFASEKHRVVVTFNDETGNQGKIIYGQTTRKIHKGASLLGWSYSEDKGKNWTYGGKVSPPNGWSVLWGDPAITTSGASYAVVFISNLAIPDEKFPSGGIDGWVTYGAKGAYIGGACIVRSTNGGVSFSNYQCFGNKEPVADDPDAIKGHFYDGAGMASTPSGEVFAAYADISVSKIDVWRASTHNGTFVRIANPFPGLVTASHPRLRASTDGWLYVAATVVAQNGLAIYINRYKNGQWAQPANATELAVGGGGEVVLNSTVDGSPMTIRFGPQFAFDIGAASEGGNDAIRFLYTRKSSGRLYVEGSACAADLSNCHPVPEWKAGPSSPGATPFDAFNPAVAASPGLGNLEPRWTSSFYERYGSSVTTVGLSRMNLVYINGAPLGFPVSLVDDITVCSDTRGYWGDYDDMLHAGFDDTTPVFIRFTSTDHGSGCNKRWNFVAEHQHVQSIREPKSK